MSGQTIADGDDRQALSPAEADDAAAAAARKAHKKSAMRRFCALLNCCAQPEKSGAASDDTDAPRLAPEKKTTKVGGGLRAIRAGKLLASEKPVGKAPDTSTTDTRDPAEGIARASEKQAVNNDDAAQPQTQPPPPAMPSSLQQDSARQMPPPPPSPSSPEQQDNREVKEKVIIPSPDLDEHSVALQQQKSPPQLILPQPAPERTSAAPSSSELTLNTVAGQENTPQATELKVFVQAPTPVVPQSEPSPLANEPGNTVPPAVIAAATAAAAAATATTASVSSPVESSDGDVEMSDAPPLASADRFPEPTDAVENKAVSLDGSGSSTLINQSPVAQSPTLADDNIYTDESIHTEEDADDKAEHQSEQQQLQQQQQQQQQQPEQEQEHHDVIVRQPPGAEQQQWLLPPKEPRFSGRKCLVLDLDETLVHSSFKVSNWRRIKLKV
jgi:hypothetical protein